MLQAYALQTPGLTNDEKKAIKATLEQAQKDYEKPLRTSQGLQGRQIDAIYDIGNFSVQADVSSNNQSTAKIHLLVLPYFALEEFKNQKLPEKSPLHQTVTLMQARYPSTKKERDRQQAVCQLPNAQKESCFHISQLWCLLIEGRK